MKTPDDIKIDVINYLDMHGDVDDIKQIGVFNIGILKTAFPGIDEIKLKKIESEWRKARQGMLDADYGVDS